ncbi:MAG: phosphoribosylformylglycinamidine synthase [Pseudomonadota bacterium]|jgi:phosphoribosylformylglycinamidine synthase
MTTVRIELSLRPDAFDARGAEVLHQAELAGLRGLTGVRVSDLFFLRGASLTAADVDAIVAKLLLDPVVATASVVPWPSTGAAASTGVVVEVAPLPGVTDAPAESLLAVAHDLGFQTLEQAATGRRFVLEGPLAHADVEAFAAGTLANTVVERFVLDAAIEPPFVATTPATRRVEVLEMRALDGDGLVALSKARRLSLDGTEMAAIQAWYRAEGRDPTDAELEMFAQTWSEHCVHKTFKARIEVDEDGVHSVVDSMFKSHIAAATKAADSDWLVSVFVDNAGIVTFEEGWQLAFKAETHNHPSALEPFGGANTGVGGVIRDVLGVSARPIAATDVLCFGPPDTPESAVPGGSLHPRRIAAGVVAGVGDYGNKMGIPTVNGAVVYDPGYVANPLVYCGCVGLLPEGAHKRNAQPGDLVVVLGGRTGRDGLRGATFSSMEMDVETASIAGTSVQIGHAIHEKQAMEALLQARDEGLYTAVTDCGAGGLSSAIGEMAEHLGAEIFLERVPLKYAGLEPWEIWLSEAQERMVLAVPPAHWDRFQAIAALWKTEATALGTFTGAGRLTLRHGDILVADLTMSALHEGIPQRNLKAVWRTPKLSEPSEPTSDPMADLLGMLATPNLRSKEAIVRTYDHEVQGGTVVKPFVGPAMDGPSDAAVLRPLEVVRATGRHDGLGVALSNGIRPAYSQIDPYGMALAVIDEAVRNAVAVGANPDKVALLDNFCWGNPNLPDRLGGLVRCSRGCYDGALAWNAPYISGKDSLNNETTGPDGQKHAIPGTLLISVLALVPDVARAVTMDAKQVGNTLYVVGLTADECGAGAWYELHGLLGANLPKPRVPQLALARALHGALREGWVAACHDASEGGLAVAVAEMAMAGRLGANVDLGSVPWEGPGDTPRKRAFSESLTRWVCEVTPANVPAFEAALAGHPFARIGDVCAAAEVRFAGLGAVSLESLKAAFAG